VYRFLLTGIKNICCVSGLNKDELKTIFPHASINLISNGVDADEFLPTFDYNSENTIVAVGTLRWHKGFDRLIVMFSSIVKTHPEWVLKIIGDGPDKEMLQQLIISLDLQHNVFLTGALGRDKLTRELSSAKIFALSSVTEGLPKVLLEAMCAKSACVAFDVGDCARALDNCGLLIEPGCSDSFIQAVVSLINDTSMQRQLSVLAERRAKAFSWNKYLDLHQKLYQQALLNC
jgi:glycosyltransferase involved in cell wall biosynthesis